MTWTAADRARGHGRRRRRARLRMGSSHSRRKTITLVAVLRVSGVAAPMVLKRPCAGGWFEACSRHVLAQTLTS